MAQKKVRVAIIGIGNCASSLVQGVQFFKTLPKQFRDDIRREKVEALINGDSNE